MSEQTAVTKRATMAPEKEARLAEIKAQNAMAAQIRGQMWAKDASHETIRAVAEYCRQNGLDPVRHVELLGGRVYLTATLYEERAAPLIQRGILIPYEPEFINADPRLDALANAGDEWAINERTRRMRLRIEHNVPEKAEAAVIQRIEIAETRRTVIGVNWCGKGLRMKTTKDGSRTWDDDPVGGAEPAKTAITRAGRRAWKQVAEVVPTFGEKFAELERQAEVTGEIIVQQIADRPEVKQIGTKGATMTVDYSEADEQPPKYDALNITPTVIDDDHNAKTQAAVRAAVERLDAELGEAA